MSVKIIIDDFYIEERKKVYVADFLTLEDYNRFCKATGFQSQGGSAFLIKNLRLNENKIIQREDCFELNTDNIRSKVQIEHNENSYLLGFTFDFGQNPEHQDVLTKISKNEVQIIQRQNAQNYPTDFAIEDMISSNNVEVWVNNVGQGNWNEVRVNGITKLVYDMGANIHADKTEIDHINNRILRRYTQKPLLVLSHWDKDHYHCLLGDLGGNAAGLFSGFVYPSVIPNATSEIVRNKMKLLLGSNKMYPINLIRKRKGEVAIPVKFKASSFYSFYKGMFCSDRNLGCIQIVIESGNSISILCGDSHWFQLSHILRQYIYSLGISTKTCNIVVPHHGSATDVTYQSFFVPFNMKNGIAAISVDEKRNNYKHPSNSIINYLSSTTFTVERTDRQVAPGDIIIK